MTLDRASVTVASRVMLPTYAIVNAIFAAAFLSDVQGRLEVAPALDFARSWPPIEQWGLLWFALAAVMVMALLVHHRTTYVVALAINVAAWLMWGILTGASVLTQELVTPLAGVLPCFVAAASFASMMSLLGREV